MPDAINYNPFALLNPGPLPARIPNSFGPPPGTIMPNNYDMLKAVLDEQAAAYASKGQTNPNPFTAQQIWQQSPGLSPEQQAQKNAEGIAKINAEQQAGAVFNGQTLGPQPTVAQILQQFPKNVNPLPDFLKSLSSSTGLTQGGASTSTAQSQSGGGSFNTAASHAAVANPLKAILANRISSLHGSPVNMRNLVVAPRAAAGAGGK